MVVSKLRSIQVSNLGFQGSPEVFIKINICVPVEKLKMSGDFRQFPSHRNLIEKYWDGSDFNPFREPIVN